MREVLLGPLPLKDPMTPVRISHELKDLIVLDQRIQQPFRILVMHIVIARPVNIQQIAPQILSIGDRRARQKILLVFLRQPHISLLVQVVIAQLIADRGNRNPGLINLRILK